MRGDRLSLWSKLTVQPGVALVGLLILPIYSSVHRIRVLKMRSEIEDAKSKARLVA